MTAGEPRPEDAQGGAPAAPLPNGPYAGPAQNGPYDSPEHGPYSYPARAAPAQAGWSAIRRGPGPGHPRRRWVRRLFTLAMALVAAGGLLFGGLLLFTPSVQDAPALARAIDTAHHAPYPGPPVPANFAAALVSTEDHRFYSEPGIDPFAVARLVVGTLTGRPDQGGSTLYQQLAKMLYESGKPGLIHQAEEVGLGIKLAFAFPRAQTLQMYADVAYFGHGYYGLSQASCGYFGVTPARLSWAQAAMLAGLVQAPSYYDPIAHLATARARQAHVLGRLAATGSLSQAQASSAYQQPLHLVGGPANRCSG